MTQRNAPQISAFTSKANGLLNVLQTEVSVFQSIPNQKPKVEKFTAIWDTGATSSVITPSIKMIDYVEEINKSMSSKSLEKSLSKKVGRNDPCPCGSGKKYKHCHGK